MKSNAKIPAIFTLTALISVVCALPSVFAADPPETAQMSFPYVAQITGDNVNVRSGPGTNYYSCGKLNKNDRVTVVASQFSWSRIVPPAGSFSWISKEYVTVDPADNSTGIVTGEAVRVYAGSDDLKPIHSTTLQLKLNRDDEVKLLGQEQDGYYKIIPPNGAYLWVTTDYTQPLGSVEQVPAVTKSSAPVEQKPQPEPVQPAPALPVPSASVKVVADAAVEAASLREYDALEKQIEAERIKPMAQQNYADIKNALTRIANNKQAGKAARYAEYGLKRVERCQLALEADKLVPLQDGQLQQLYRQIEKARDNKLAQIPQTYRFAVIGRLHLSNIYGPQEQTKRYRVVDDAGKTACYAVAAGPALSIDADKFIDKKIGLVGTIEPDPETASALVKFTEISEIN